MTPHELIGAFGLGVFVASLIYLAIDKYEKSAALDRSAAGRHDLQSCGVAGLNLAEFTLDLLIAKGVITADDLTDLVDAAIASLGANPEFVETADLLREMYKRPATGSTETESGTEGAL